MEETYVFVFVMTTNTSCARRCGSNLHMYICSCLIYFNIYVNRYGISICVSNILNRIGLRCKPIVDVCARLMLISHTVMYDA